MAIGIYKPGQGYWVRVLTASLLGVLILATSAWIWGQAHIAVEKLPRSVWTIPLASTTGTPPAAGSRVTLISKQQPTASLAGSPPEGETIGTAEVIEYDTQNRTLRVKGVEIMKTS